MLHRSHASLKPQKIEAFRLVKLDGGTKWEELPGGPKAQGLGLAAHGGKVYRVGGMQPKNAPGETFVPSANPSQPVVPKKGLGLAMPDSAIAPAAPTPFA